MNFELSEDHQMLRQMVREFVQAEIVPHAAQWDREEKFPAHVFKKAGELGLMGICVPEEYGGAGMDYMAYAIAIEEFAAGDGSAALTVASHNGLCTGHILVAADEEQKRRFLPDLASGHKFGAWGLTEPGSGSDASGMRTRAVRDGDDWILNGTKIFITQGSVGEIAVVLAATNPELKQRGISTFVLERGMPGFSAGRHIEKLGMRSSDTTELVLENVRVPEANRIGVLDGGFVDALKILDRGRISIGALAVGLGRAALEAAIRYAKDRKQFGQPISSFQAIQWMISDSATELDAARLLVHRAAWTQDQGKNTTLESAMAKLYASEAAMRACDRAIQVHGGYGYTREYAVERMWRDAKLCTIGEGTSEIQRMVIARQILRQFR